MKILNIGSLNMDHTYQVQHIVQNGETLSATDFALHCGGKGLNQSIALARAGATVWHAGKIGTDGTVLATLLQQNNVNISLLQTTHQTPTGHAIIQVDTTGQNSIIVYGGANKMICPDDVDGFLSHFAPGDLLLVQNEISSLPYAITQAHTKGMLVALNPSPIGNLATEPALSLVDIFILNEVEGFQLTGEREPHRICDALIHRWPVCQVVLTLGSEGCMYAHSSTRLVQEAYPTHLTDTTAAGDTFTGFFLGCLARGDGLPRALVEASMAASIAVSRAGASASIPYRDEVLAAFP